MADQPSKLNLNGKFRASALDRAAFQSAALTNQERHRNPDPAPMTADPKDKGVAACNHCKRAGRKFEVVWDQAGFAQMETHLLECHPEII